MKRFKSTWIAWVVTGLLLGMLTALLITITMWPVLQNHQAAYFIPTPQARVMTPTVNAAEILQQARDAINAGWPQHVEKILFPVAATFPETAERSLAYRLLAEAEIRQGHYQLAAGYYENLYANEPTPDNLLLVAITYDQGGDLDHALSAYRRLATAEPTLVDEMEIEQRIVHITRVLEARHNGATLTPEWESH